MWPKLIAQLLELLPHVSRLVPVADKYFSSKSVSERAQEAAIAAVAENLRAGVDGLGGTQAALQEQLKVQAGELALLRENLKAIQIGLAVQENRLAAIEHGVRAVRLWVAAGVVLMVTMLGTLIVIAVHEVK